MCIFYLPSQQSPYWLTPRWRHVFFLNCLSIMRESMLIIITKRKYLVSCGEQTREGEKSLLCLFKFFTSIVHRTLTWREYRCLNSRPSRESSFAKLIDDVDSSAAGNCGEEIDIVSPMVSPMMSGSDWFHWKQSDVLLGIKRLQVAGLIDI